MVILFPSVKDWRTRTLQTSRARPSDADPTIREHPLPTPKPTGALD